MPGRLAGRRQEEKGGGTIVDFDVFAPIFCGKKEKGEAKTSTLGGKGKKRATSFL